MFMSIIGMINLVIGILDLRFDYDKYTYGWLTLSLLYSIFGALSMYMKSKSKQ